MKLNVTKYTVVKSTDIVAFIKMVNDLGRDGFVPIGGVSIASNGGTDAFAQALIRTRLEEVEDES